MRYLIPISTAFSLAVALGPLSIAAAEIDEEAVAKKFSYILGMQTGNSLRGQLPQAIDDIDLDAMQQGIDDAMHGRDPGMDVAEITYWSGLFLKVLEERRKSRGDEFLAQGKAFRDAYSKREGVRSVSSGLLYRELRAGTGRQPGIGQKVLVHYRGMHIDGTEFDSSITRGEPVELALRKVIPGWQEALTLMPLGAKWEVVLPAELAYGEKGTGKVGPNETLVFEIELIEIR